MAKKNPNSESRLITIPAGKIDRHLQKLFSSRETAILAQYDQIRTLLGSTTDWTHPGTHCEILIRDLVRSVLPEGYSVEKGYFHGRVSYQGRQSTKHPPEIDILIHDSKNFAPLFRLGDFVIVEPAAVRGIIQIKRGFGINTRKKTATNTLDNAIRQTTEAMASLYSLAGPVDGNDARTSFDRIFAATIAMENQFSPHADLIEQTKTALTKVYRGIKTKGEGVNLVWNGMHFLPDMVLALKDGYAFVGLSPVAIDLKHRTDIINKEFSDPSKPFARPYFYCPTLFPNRTNNGLRILADRVKRHVLNPRTAGSVPEFGIEETGF